MKNIYLYLLALLSLAGPGIATAQTLENGDVKTGRFTETQHEVWYTLTLQTEGDATIAVSSVSNVRIDGLDLYAEFNGENHWRTGSTWIEGGRILTCADMGIGTYKVRVTGSPTNNATSGTFQITCVLSQPSYKSDPEPNGTWQQAAFLTQGETMPGRMGYQFYNDRDNTDWFRLEVPEDGKLTFETKSDQSLRLGSLNLYTLNADGADVSWRTSKDMDGYGRDTTIVFEIPNVSAGTYYVRQDRYTGVGSYQLIYYFTSHSLNADPEPNGTWKEAIELNAGPSVSGQLGYDYQNSTDGVDWYKIEVPDEGTVILNTSSETTLRLGSLNLYTYNADQSDVSWRTSKDMDGYAKDTTVFFTIVDCAAGTYFLRLDRYTGYGTYTLKYTFNTNSHQKDPEPNNDWTKVSEIKLGTTQQGRLGYFYYNDRDGVDWYKVEIPDEGTLALTTTSETTLRLGSLNLYTYNAERTDVSWRTSKDMDGYSKDTTVVFTIADLAPGTYFLRQDRYTGQGGYKLKVEFTPNPYGPDSFDNNAWDKATEITSGITQQGRLGYFYYNDRDGVDWYRFEISADGEAVFTTTSETTLRLGSLNLYTYNGERTDVSWRTSKDMDGYSKDTTVIFIISDLAPGTYFLRQDRYTGQGGYALTYRFNPNPYWRERIDNNKFDGRLELKKGKTVYTTLGFFYYNDRNTEDWYDLGTFNRDVIDITICPDTTHSLNMSNVDWYRWDGTYRGNPPHPESESLHRSGWLLHCDGRRRGGSGSTRSRLCQLSGSAYHCRWTQHSAQGRGLLQPHHHLQHEQCAHNASCPGHLRFERHQHPRLRDARRSGHHLSACRQRPRRGRAVFIVPGLDPWQFYTFNLISEGVGDINFIPVRPGEDVAERIRAFEPFSTAIVLGFVVDCAWDIVQDQLGIDHFISRTAGEVLALNEQEERQYCKFLNLTYEQYHGEQPGVAAYTAKSVIKTACVKGIEKIPVIGTTIKAVGSAIEIMQNIVPNLRRRLWYWIYKDLGYIKDDLEVRDGKQPINGVVTSWDPNEMCGPQGVGEQHYIAGEQTIGYTIMFENKAEAGDAAYRVRISDVLDEEVFDVCTVRFGGTSHDGVGYNWKMTREGNRLSWDIEGIELPPNVNAPEGEGFVTFTVGLKPGLPDGTVIRNKAEIIFDKNFPIETNVYTNTLDLTAPVTTMSEANYDTANELIAINCSSYDAASGVDSYQLFVSKDGGDYTCAGQFPDQVFYSVPAGDGATYSFYVLAIDRVGNAEVIIPDAIPFTNGIRIIRADDPSLIRRIYTLDGKYLGDDVSTLPAGIYIQGGKKLIVK